MKKIILIFFIFPFVCFGNQIKEVTIEVKVKGVGCNQDVKTINKRINEIEGVKLCEIQKSGSTTDFKITYDDTKTNKKEIYEIIEDTGGCKDPKSRPYKVKK